MGKKPKFTKEQIEKRKKAWGNVNNATVARAKARREDPTARYKVQSAEPV